VELACCSSGWYYKGSDFSVLQLVWPDKKGIFPWQIGFNPAFVHAQPVLELSPRAER
jgi:hypothetical protein